MDYVPKITQDYKKNNFKLVKIIFVRKPISPLCNMSGLGIKSKRYSQFLSPRVIASVQAWEIFVLRMQNEDLFGGNIKPIYPHITSVLWQDRAQYCSIFKEEMPFTLLKPCISQKIQEPVFQHFLKITFKTLNLTNVFN